MHDIEKVKKGLEYTWEYIRERKNPTATPKAKAMKYITDAIELLKEIEDEVKTLSVFARADGIDVDALLERKVKQDG